MAIPNTTNEIQQILDETKDSIQAHAPEYSMSGIGTDYATSNRWIGYFPIQNVLGIEYQNLELNLFRFTIPRMTMDSDTISLRGYQYEIPTKLLDSQTKEITIEYIVDAKWYNYKALFTWVSNMEGNINKVDTQTKINSITQNALINCRVWLIDHYKNRIIDFTFYDCWIKQFGDLALEASNPNEVKHSFVMAYSHFEITKATV